MKEIVIIWIAIILIASSLLFPPFGYTRFTIISYIGSSPNRIETHIDVPWTYVAHRFIFSEPPNTDPVLNKKFKSGDLTAKTVTLVTVDDMRVEWLVVLIQIAVIVLLASGTVFTLRSRRIHANV